MTDEDFKIFQQEHKNKSTEKLFLNQIFYSFNNLHTKNIKDIFADIDYNFNFDWEKLNQNELTNEFKKLKKLVREHRIYKMYYND